MAGTPHDTVVHMLRKPRPADTEIAAPTQRCPGCGSSFHPGGRKQCPAFRLVCHTCNKVGHLARVCKSRRPTEPTATPSRDAGPSTRAVSVATSRTSPSATRNAHGALHIESAPTIEVHIANPNGSATVKALPDSGADISVAGTDIVELLGDHKDNLLPSHVTPRTVSGHTMNPIGRLPVTITLGMATQKDDLYIHPNVKGLLLSWKASKHLRILPAHYPAPIEQQPSARSLTTGPTPPRPHSVTSEDLMSDFPSVFDGQVKAMEGERFHIILTNDAKPFCVKTPRQIPFAYRDKLRAELTTLQEQGIIMPVTHPTEWCAPIVVTPKKESESIRMCVDLSHLNRYVKRERYQSATPAQAVADITAEDAKIFTKMDAKKGYHQCPLDEGSQDLTTFITPFGRFKFLRAPYGISSISEHYNRRMDEAFDGLLGFRRVVDDVVIYDNDPTQHTQHVRQFLQRCVEKKITLNVDKWKFAQSAVTFAGLCLSPEGYHVDPSIIQAIADFPTPANRTDLRSFIGMVNQLSSATATVATLLSPLRPLLRTRNEFVWSDDFEHAFKAAKASLTSAPTLAYFDPTKPTRLCTDASRQGLGFILQQQHADAWLIIQAGSRFLSDAESRYAVVELELLAVSWAINKCHMFLAGMHFTVVTDHHPLIPILNTHRLDEIENPRLQRLKTKIMGYTFKAEWLKGALNHAPDALSRYPSSDPTPDEQLAEQDLDSHQAATAVEIRAIAGGDQDSPRLQDLREAAESDHEYQQLKHYIYNGFPDHRQNLPEQCRRYWHVRAQLSVEDDFIVYGCRLLVPATLRREVLNQLHDSHQGMVRTKERARLCVYWPGIDNDIQNLVLSCKTCQDLLPSNPREPMIAKAPPARPFQEVAGDFCSHAGHQYLILVDCYSDWPEITPMESRTTATQLTSALRASFCRTGVPDTFWSDGGPQFTSREFKDFARQWGFRHTTSSPQYPQSNGKAEATVKSMKKLLRAAWTGRAINQNHLARALLQYRNTPSRKDGLSPAQKLFGRPIQDTLPAHRRAFAAEWQTRAEESERQALATKDATEKSYNQHTRPLPDITIGSHVAIQNQDTKHWDRYGIVVDISRYRRYFVKTGNGRILVRNRRFIRRRVPMSLPASLNHADDPPVLPHPQHPPRRSARTHRPTKRLIEEMNTFSLQADCIKHRPGRRGGGDVGN